MFNPKGGVGKTTTAVNLAASLARSGRTTLLVDLEADLNASISLGVRPGEATPSIAELLLHQPAAVVGGSRASAASPTCTLITGSPVLTGMDAALRNVRQPERRLADVLRPLDASGSTSSSSTRRPAIRCCRVSVPLIAEHLIVPIRADYLSLESLAQFLRWYRDCRAARKGLASLGGILLTMVDYRRQATREIVDMIRRHNRHGVCRVEIPQDPRVAEAPSHGIPLVHYCALARQCRLPPTDARSCCSGWRRGADRPRPCAAPVNCSRIEPRPFTRRI